MSPSRARFACAVLLLGCSGCAVRQSTRHYRLVRQAEKPVLVPPGVKRADTASRKFTVPGGTQGQACDEIRRRGSKATVRVDRAGLLTRPAGWLATWAAELESRGCIAHGAGQALAERVVEGLPLPPALPVHLLYATSAAGGFADLRPGRLELVRPAMRDGTDGNDELFEVQRVTGTGTQLNLDVKSSPDLLGYERIWYAVQPKPGGSGLAIVPLTTERVVKGQTEARPAGAGYLRFAPAAACYRLLYKSGGSGRTITAIVVAARSRAELETAARAAAGAESCERSAPGMCAVIPGRVGINAFVVATVNGKETPLAERATVASAIRSTGERSPERVLPGLRVSRPHAGRLVPVEFDRGSHDVLNLTLRGGEEISWR